MGTALSDGGYLVEVFAGGSHLLPGLVEQLDADAEELLEGAVVGEEHGVEVVAVFAGCGQRGQSVTQGRAERLRGRRCDLPLLPESSINLITARLIPTSTR